MANLMLQRRQSRYRLRSFLLLAVFTASCSTESGSGVHRHPTSLLAADAGVPSAAVYDPCPPAPAKCLIMPLGDSMTSGTDGQEGYRGELYRLLQGTGRPFDFVGTQPSAGYGTGHEGHPNAHIDLLTGYQDIWIPMFKPHVILMMIGVNDLDLHYLQHVATYAAILDHIAQLVPQSLILVALIPNTTVTPDLAIAFNAALAQQVNTRIADGKHLLLVDGHSVIRKRDLSADGIHPVHAGYVRLAQAWYALLSRFMHTP